MDDSSRVRSLLAATRARVQQLSLVRLGLFLVPATFLVVVVGIPFGFFLWGSFWTTTPGFGGQFTLAGYEIVFTNDAVRSTLKNTVILAFFGTFVALAIGTMAMIFTLKMDVPRWLASAVSAVMIVQLLLPSFIQALAWEFYLGPYGLINRFLLLFPFVSEPVVSPYNIWTIAFIFGTHYAGLVYLLTSGALKAIPPELEEIALISGASKRRIFSEIDLQLIRPSLYVATIIVFVRGIQSFSVPLVLGLPNRIFTLATLMYLELNEYPTNFTFVGAVGIVILLLSIWLLVIQQRLSGARRQYETVTGSGESTDPARFYTNRPFAVGFLALVVLAYLAPISMVVVGSFQRAWVGLRPGVTTWSLEGYRVLLVGEWAELFSQSVTNAAVLAFLAGAFAIALAIVISYLSVKTDWRGGAFLGYLSYAPIAIPGIVLATALQWMILEYNEVLGFLYGSLVVLVIVYTGKFLVYGVRATNGSLRSVGSNLEEAALISGGGKTTVLREIYAPLIAPGLLAGFIIIAIDTTKSLAIPLILGGNKYYIVQNTIWFFITQSELNVAAAYSVLLLFGLSIVYGIAYRLGLDITSI